MEESLRRLEKIPSRKGKHDVECDVRSKVGDLPMLSGHLVSIERLFDECVEPLLILLVLGFGLRCCFDVSLWMDNREISIEKRSSWEDTVGKV